MSDTVFCDIDGTIIVHRGDLQTMLDSEPLPIQTTIDTLNQLADEGHLIVLVTARPEYSRLRTIAQLDQVGVRYHRLFMDMTAGKRCVVNDGKPKMPKTAYGITVQRDRGLSMNQYIKETL